MFQPSPRALALALIAGGTALYMLTREAPAGLGFVLIGVITLFLVERRTRPGGPPDGVERRRNYQARKVRL